jgi:pantoate--beta-alanine ligase
VTTVRLIGPGRAGRSFAAALADVGYDVHGVLARGEVLSAAAHGVDILVIATPDRAIAEVAAAVEPDPDAVVIHLSGAHTLDVLAPHPRRASLHPLVPLPSPEVGRVRLRAGITFAVAGDPEAARLARVLGGSVVTVDDQHRASYHAAACIAANHVVALMGQVERVAASAGLGLEPFVDLARAALTDAGELGPAIALTGPAARGDDATIDRHRRELDPDERAGYDAGVVLARRLAALRPSAERAGRVAGAAHGRRALTATRRPGSERTVSGRGQARGGSDVTARAVPVVATARQFADSLEAARAVGRTVGLVPTMGALHAGHRSLVARAAQECDVVAVTVFVNPIQFDDPADLDAYPRDLEADVALAGGAGATIVFAPAVDEMYGAAAGAPTTVHVTGVSERLEGAARPGHFDGVATVVAKLFGLAGRCRAYFGEKDFQQLAVVRQLVADLCLPVEVIGCATVRDADGLALSSRNLRLTADGRAAAAVLHRALEAGLAALDAGERDPEAVDAAMAAALALEPAVVPDYATVVDAATLAPPPVLQGELRLLVAGRVEDIRLIDNEGATVAPEASSTPRRLALTTTAEER